MSKHLEKAIQGDEVSLLNMIYFIQSNNLLNEDIEDLKNNNKNDNIHVKFLKACLYFYGASNFSVDVKKAKTILKELIKNDNFSYAKNLYYIIYCKSNENKINESNIFFKPLFEDQVKLLKEAANELNPLAIINVFSEAYFKRPILLGLPDLHKDIAFLSLALKQLSMTEYHEVTDYYIGALKDFLHGAIGTIDILKKEFDSRKRNHFLRYYSVPIELSPVFDKKFTKPETLSLLVKAWIAIANHHKAFNQRYLMLDALQNAYAIKPKETVKKQWLEELGVNDLKGLQAYVKFVDKLAGVAIKKMVSMSLSEKNPQQSNTVLFNLGVEIKNIAMLMESLSNKLTLSEARKLNETIKQIKDKYEIIKQNFHEKGEDHEKEKEENDKPFPARLNK